MRSLFEKVGLIAAILVLGYALIEIVPNVVDHYERLSRTNRTLGRVYLAGVLTGSALLLGAGAWSVYVLARNSLSRRARRQRDQKPIEQMSESEKEGMVTATLDDIKKLIDRETTAGAAHTDAGTKLEEIQQSLESGELRIAAFGTISSGKSALLNTLAGEEVFSSDVVGGTTVRCASIPLPSEDKVLLVDTPGLGEDRGIDHERIAREQAMDADLILFVLDNDMRSFEDDVLKVLVGAKKPLVVCLNKSDWYGAEKVPILLAKTVERVDRHGIPRENVVPVRTAAARRTRVRVLTDGSEIEETVMLGPDVEPLLSRLSVALDERKGLHLNNLIAQSRRLFAEMRERSRARLDADAWQVVNRTTWQAATAAAISPLPILDIVIGMGFIGKMVKELAAVYQIEIDLESARRLLGELGANAASIVGVNLATPTAASLAASWIKAVPGVGTLVGGTLQGFVQALMVRWIGSTFITYFRKEMKIDGGLADLARQKWLEATTPTALAELLKETRVHSGRQTQEVS
jgi:ribosome biogenesis GTPase A